MQWIFNSIFHELRFLIIKKNWWFCSVTGVSVNHFVQLTIPYVFVITPPLPISDKCPLSYCCKFLQWKYRVNIVLKKIIFWHHSRFMIIGSFIKMLLLFNMDTMGVKFMWRFKFPSQKLAYTIFIVSLVNLYLLCGLVLFVWSVNLIWRIHNLKYMPCNLVEMDVSLTSVWYWKKQITWQEHISKYI